MLSVWTWIFLKRDSYSILIKRTRSRQSHSKPILVSPCKPPDTVIDNYKSQNFGLKTWVDIWNRIDLVIVEYVTFSQTPHLKMWLFKFINGTNFSWDYVL